MSIYSERQGEDPKRFEWRYRVKNRDHIPQFFQDPVNQQMPLQRFSTPDLQHEMEITFLDDMLREKKQSALEQHKISEEKLERLATSHRLNKNQEESIDEDLLFGSDSDDSFTKDYTIPKDTLRKERIIKRDEARFQIEKKHREEDLAIKIAMEKAEKEDEEQNAKKEAEEAENEEAEKLESYR